MLTLLVGYFATRCGFRTSTLGGGWLIFALPPAELAAHPTAERPHHELYLMCDDVHATVSEWRRKVIEFTKGMIERQWGLTTAFRLPGGGELGSYAARHPRPLASE